MNLITLIILLVVLGFLMYLVNTRIPMSPGWKQLINVLVLLIVGIWLLLNVLAPLLPNITF